MDVLCKTVFVLLFIAVSSQSWNYKSKGPEAWLKDYPECSKKSQSPINIVPEDAETDYDLPTIDRKIFDTPPTKFTIMNSKYSLVGLFEEGAYELKDAKLLPFNARMLQYHFHWGQNPDTGGSEHTLSGKSYFAELHAVHYNTKYVDVGKAMDAPDGLAVFGWFIDVDYPQKNEAFDLFLETAKSNVLQDGNYTEVKPAFSLETLLPADLSTYYRYKGSLTTPGCAESVLWTVFKEPIRISRSQADILSSTFMDADQSPIRGNFRPVQPLNGRKVTKSPKLVPESGGSCVTPSLLLAFASTFLVLLY